MSDATTVLLNMIDKQWSQAQQSENQRATMTNIIILVAGTLQGFIVQRGFDKLSLVLAGVLILLGIFGALSSAKYYERFRLGMLRVGKMIDRLEELHKDARIWELEKKADVEHKKRFPRLTKLRLNRLWLTLHISISILGVLNIVMITILWK